MQTNLSKAIDVAKFLRSTWLLGVAIFTLELFARIDDWVQHDAPLLGTYNFNKLFQNTDEGRRGVPNGRYRHLQLNADGLKGPEILPDAGQQRIVVYAASEAFGIYESAGKEFPRVLEAELNARSPNTEYEVINGGSPGMRVGSGITFLRDLSLRLNPSVVVIYPTPTHYIGVTQAQCGRAVGKSVAEHQLLPKSRVAGKLKDQVELILPRNLINWLQKAVIGWQTRNQEVLERISADSLQAFEVDLKCLVATVRELGIQPVLSTHANRFGETAQNDSPWLTGWRFQYPFLRESGFIDLEQRANNTIRKVAQSEKVPLVDAAAVLSGRTEWFVDHAHFNDAGAAMIATVMAPVVIENLQHALSRQNTQT